MKCPHCRVEFHEDRRIVQLTDDGSGNWFAETSLCPSCNKQTIVLNNKWIKSSEGGMHAHWVEKRQMVYPPGTIRSPVPVEVSEYVAVDYTEACLVLDYSPKASAALSRRCLQNLLIDKAKVAKGDLSKQIQEVIDSGRLPSHLEESIDAIRNIGNFAAHPNKSKTTGEVVDVEPHEAEWTLDVLEELFDFYYVQPEKSRIRKAALDAKLADTGKPPMK